MKKTIVVLALACGMPAGFALAQPDGGPPPPEGPAHGREFRPEGPGHPGGFRLLPPPLERELNLTPEQHRQIAALTAEVKAKLENILTVAQMKRLRQMPPPGMGRGPRHDGREFGGGGEPEGLPGGPGEPGWRHGHPGMGGPEEWDRPGGERGLPRPDGDRPAKGHGPTDKPDRDADSRAPRDGFGPPHHPGPGRDDGPAAERRHEGPGGQAGPGQDRAGQEPPEEK